MNLIGFLLVLSFAFDLAGVKSEPNLERRSELALLNANSALDSARDAYGKGDLGVTQSALDEAAESVDLAYQSLVDNGKDPRRDPKYFKKAELKTRELLRRVEGMKASFSFADREMIDRLRAHVAEVHDNLLKGIMSRKK